MCVLKASLIFTLFAFLSGGAARAQNLISSQKNFLEKAEFNQLKVIGDGLQDNLGNTFYLACKNDSCEQTQLVTHTRNAKKEDVYQWSGVILKSNEKLADELSPKEFKIARYLSAEPTSPAKLGFLYQCAERNMKFAPKWSLKNKIDFELFDHPRFGMIYKHINKIAFVFKNKSKHISDTEIATTSPSHLAYIKSLFSEEITDQ